MYEVDEVCQDKLVEIRQAVDHLEKSLNVVVTFRARVLSIRFNPEIEKRRILDIVNRSFSS